MSVATRPAFTLKQVIKIVNCKGIPGTGDCIAYSVEDKQPVLLSNWHIMYGKSAVKGDTIWMAEPGINKQELCEIGKVIKGKIGVVPFGRKSIYVDCAISSFHSAGSSGLFLPLPDGHAIPRKGEQVYKYGAATGFTRGVIVEDGYTDKACIEGQIFHAPGQLLIRAENGLPFSGNGDSGSVIMNDDNRVVGLLWGTTGQGDGLACPIEPVMSILNIDFRSS